MKRGTRVFLFAFLGACGGGTEPDGAASSTNGATTYTDNMPDDLPAGGCRASSSGSGGDCDAATTTAGAGSAGNTDNECEVSADCDGAGSCVASWEDEARGAFECRFACIPSFDDASWCSDDASCCDAAATCTARGYCVVLDGDASSSSGGDASSSSGGDASSTDTSSTTTGGQG